MTPSIALTNSSQTIVSPNEAVAERLGHSNVQMVIRTYAHLFAKRKTEVVDKLNTLTCGDINN